ncbi:MAG TPA: 16S rRNA (uracil(1498)-N(3))-methyltransferase [Eoetvoesiella sp.]|uniref:16S rRNA (uracil(1498)-N(3))-methyltransferase n=1 Tax=Eoetvoesiella sp. TaxID=1966355 RepID=UPI002CC2BF59|nr:16S rRNA (uracil(1498)-N(3))-methyltransferase [Eoetvoesiella sp.]HWK60455.1 16S rRNA (uracil(1498)-N(3))-methyltransferase [Eoetvoesiella sp.]
MAAPRFFCPVPLHADQLIELPQELAHHALRVLRLKPGSAIVLFDGLGGQYPAQLIAEGKKGYARTGAHQAVEAELPGEIRLVQGLPSGDKMDWVVEKAVELGAVRISPIAAQRSVLQLNAERLAKRLLHWRRIAQSASEQCGRNRIMAVDAPVSLREYLAQANHAEQLTLLCQPEAPQTLEAALSASQGPIALLVGPEGGWSDEEQAEAARQPILPVRFGNRVLRTETAGLALISAVSALKRWI